MKRLFFALGIVGVLAIFSLAATSQHGSSLYLGFAETPDSKHVETTTPAGQPVTLVADSIDKDWNSAVVHLKGNVLMKIRPAGKNATNLTVVRADEGDYYEKTGEFSPRGNVWLTVRDMGH